MNIYIYIDILYIDHRYDSYDSMITYNMCMLYLYVFCIGMQIDLGFQASFPWLA